MKKTKKCIVIILIIIAVLFFIASSCTRRDNVPPGKTKIEFWTISLKPTYDGYINGIINDYKKRRPDVIVEWIDMPISVVMQKLMASIAGDASPDVVNLNSGYAQVMAQNHALVCMDDIVPDKVKDRYFDGLWNAAGFKDKNYAIPWYVTTRVLMYNKKIFEKAGLDPQKPPKNWKQVEEYARKIKEKTGIYGYMPAIKILEDMQVHGVKVISDDKNRALFNSPDGVEVLKWFVDMKKEGVMPAETLMESYAGAVDRYQGGKLGMVIAGPTLLLKIKKDAPNVYDNTLVAPMPMGEGDVVPAATMNLVVPRASKHHEIAVDFALFVTNNRNQLDFCKLAPVVPSVEKAAKAEYFKKPKTDKLMGEAVRISIEQLYRAKDLSLGLKNSAKLNRKMKEAVEAAFYERKSPKAALDEAAKEWNKILKE